MVNGKLQSAENEKTPHTHKDNPDDNAEIQGSHISISISF